MELWARDVSFSTAADFAPKRRSARLLRVVLSLALVLCDLVFLSAARALVYLTVPSIAILPVTAVAVCALYIIFGIYGRAFGVEAFQFISKSLNRAIVAIVVSVCIAVTSTLLVFGSNNSDVSTLLVLACAATLAILASRLVYDLLISKKYKPALFDRVMIVDGVPARIPPGYRSIDVRKEGIEPNGRDPMMRHWASLHLADADRVIIACNSNQYQKWANFIKGSNIRTELLVPELNNLDIAMVSRHGADTTLGISNSYLSGWNRFLKRLFDVVATAVLLIFTAPVMMICALLIKFDDGGPIFFTQPRMGRGNRLFDLYKFRSMTEKASGVQIDNITQIGSYLRSSSFDELPQLFNVLRGQMSLVGPRPHALESLAEDRFFWEIDDKYWNRHAIKPGITGLAQVRGFRGATIVQSDLTNRLNSDLEYLRGWTIWRDIMILASTLRVMVHKNAN